MCAFVQSLDGGNDHERTYVPEVSRYVSDGMPTGIPRDVEALLLKEAEGAGKVAGRSDEQHGCGTEQALRFHGVFIGSP